MKNRILNMSVLLMVLMSLQSCEIVEGIFKAGVGVGVFIVIAVVALIIFIISKVTSRK